MKFNYKKPLAAAFMTAVLAAPMVATTVASANNASGSPEEQADITNWIANTPQQVSNNMAMQHIDMNNLNGTRYIIQWGDTLSSISAATGISVAKLCYDNNIQNANLIYAGDVLILNRDGDVPAGYNPNVNPYAVAQTKVTINNGPQNVNITVMPKKVVKTYNKYVDNSTNTENNDNSKNVFAAPSDAKSATSQDDQSQSNGESESISSSSANTGTKTKSAAATNHGKKHHRSVTASELVSGLSGASGDSKLSFEEGDGGDDAESVDVDSATILKDAKKGDYDAALEEIEDALGDKADKQATVYIELDGNDLSVYVSTSDDDSSSEDSNKDDSDSDNSDSSSQDEDSNDDSSNSQATTNDEDTDSSDDDF